MSARCPHFKHHSPLIQACRVKSLGVVLTFVLTTQPLVVRGQFCGNDECDGGENCVTCPQDCGQCDFEYQCVAVAAPSSTDQSSELPPPVSHVDVGGTIYLELWATDSGSTNTGLVSAYADLEYPQSLLSCELVEHTELFNLFPEGECNGNIVDELGGSQLQGGVGVEPDWARVALVRFAASQDGFAELVLRPANSESSAFGRGVVEPSAISYGTCAVAIGNCGDEICGVDEDCSSCPLDCGCEPSESCVSGSCVACPEDCNDDGVVGPFDLACLLASWGPCPEPCTPGEPAYTCASDLDGNCNVGPFDLAMLLFAWGPCE